MPRASLLKLSALALAFSVTVAWSEPAVVGPPWISVEFPANPLDPTTRGAALVVHTFHHEKPLGFPVTGTAEGLVDGERRSIELEFKETSRIGVWALDQQWPAEGDWILAISTRGNAEASLFIQLGPDGGIAHGDYYGTRITTVVLRSAKVVAGAIDANEIEAALRSLASTD